MMTIKIAFRNILRNLRRSTMTLLAIAVGAIGIVLFGEFVRFVTLGLETGAVQRVGHLTVFRRGYLKNPSILEYRSPTFLEMPEVETFLVETDDPEGPLTVT